MTPRSHTLQRFVDTAVAAFTKLEQTPESRRSIHQISSAFGKRKLMGRALSDNMQDMNEVAFLLDHKAMDFVDCWRSYQC